MSATTSPAPTQLERVSGEVVDSPQMSAEEARRRTDAVKRNARDLMREMRALYEGGAHLALDYSSWEAYFIAEFRQPEPGEKIDPKNGYKPLRAAAQEAILSVHVDTLGIKRSQALVFCKLKELDEKLAVAAWVEEQGGWEAVTVNALERQVKEMRGEVIPVPGDVGEDAWNGVVADEMRRALVRVYDALELLGSARSKVWHFALPDAMRALERNDALTVHSRVAEERARLADARAAIDATDEHLAQVAYLLDQRGDLPPSPEPPRRDQLTVEEVIAAVEG
jgi:hypothetical protein